MDRLSPMDSLSLTRMDRFPPELDGLDVRAVRRAFAGPALVTIEGERRGPLFVSTLLHGNETTSFDVLKHLAARCRQGRPPRDLMVLVGNVAAAEAGLRVLPGQADFNRIWDQGDSAEHALAAEVLDTARAAGLFASIDLHNNTGDNPVYGCVNALRPADLHLAARFAPIGVYYLNPPTTQSIAFSRLCPAITVECGRSGDPDGLAAATGLVDWALEQESLPDTPPAPGALTLHETVGRVLVSPGNSVAFAPDRADLTLRRDLEHLNFRPMRAGDLVGESAGDGLPLTVCDEHGHDLTGEFLCRDGDAIRLVRDVTPAMVTPDLSIIRQDCLCYFMTPIAPRAAQ